MSSPRSRRRLAGALVPCVLAVLVGSCRKDAAGPGSDPGSAPAGPAATSAPGGRVHLLIAYGSEKKTWFEEQVAAFLATAPRVDGLPLEIETRAMGSGESVQAVERGELQPHVVSPASGAYITLLNDAWAKRSGKSKDLAPPGEPLVLSPLVIALWRPMAVALGWPKAKLGWKELLAVARDPKGWGKYGHPEWGAFKLGHTHPELSNSGLLAVLAAAYAGADKTRGLTVADLGSKPVRALIGAVEKSIVHYGKSTGFFADRMLARGPGYLSAAVLYENLIVEASARPNPPEMPVVAIYPREGTFWCDHPYSILDAPWVGAAERKGAEALLAFLRARPAQERALALGFRPGDPAVPIGAPIDAEHGVDAKQPQTLLEVPDGATLRALLEAWREHKRAADVIMVFDKSGSMSGAPLTQAKKGARGFLDRLSDKDDVTLTFFDGVVYPPIGPYRLGEKKPELLARIDDAFAGGGTALYDAVDAAYSQLSQRAKADPGRIHALVVMTDGKDESSAVINLESLKQKVKAEGDQPVRVFAIAYGKGASEAVLHDIAESAQGMSAKGTTSTIVQVYDEMAAFF